MTHTHWELSLVYKFSIFKALNIIIIPWLGFTDSDSVWFGRNGLIEEATLVIVFAFIGEIIRIIFYPKFWYKWYIRRYETKKGKK